MGYNYSLRYCTSCDRYDIHILVHTNTVAGFVLAGFTSLFLNLLLPEEIEDDPETPVLTADHNDELKDQEEWRRIDKSASVDDGVKKDTEA